MGQIFLEYAKNVVKKARLINSFLFFRRFFLRRVQVSYEMVSYKKERIECINKETLLVLEKWYFSVDDHVGLNSHGTPARHSLILPNLIVGGV